MVGEVFEAVWAVGLDIAFQRIIFRIWMEKALNHVVEDILASYERVAGMNNTDAYNFPSKRAVGDICEDILQILFPGFHDEEAIHKRSLPVLTRHRVSSVMDRLAEQVRQSMHLCDDARRRGQVLSLPKFFETIPKFARSAYGHRSGLRRRSGGVEQGRDHPFLSLHRGDRDSANGTRTASLRDTDHSWMMTE